MIFQIILPLFRTLLPSWRFFERLTPFPKIYYKIIEAKDQQIISNEWQLLNPNNSKKRTIGKLFYNPEENLILAFWTQVEHLLNDISSLNSTDSHRIYELNSYINVLSVIKNEVKLKFPSCISFDFKIEIIHFDLSSNQVMPQNLQVLYSSGVSFNES